MRISDVLKIVPKNGAPNIADYTVLGQCQLYNYIYQPGNMSGILTYIYPFEEAEFLWRNPNFSGVGVPLESKGKSVNFNACYVMLLC